jgi:hypothetical protein
MGMREIAYRVRQQLQNKAFCFGIGAAYQPPKPQITHFGNPFISVEPVGIDQIALLNAADELLSGRWNIFSMRSAELGFPPCWNKDPKTGTLAPLAFGKSIDYRDERIVGDIKYLWEPSRHLGLVTLAAAWRVSGDARYVEGATTLLVSWMDQCPYPVGVHWASSLELAIRLVNWSIAWHLFGGENGILFHGASGQAFQRRWLDCIYQHCYFIDSFYSRHSSANNHLFCEYMGLFVAALTWPCWEKSAAWAAKAKAGLEVEALRQNAIDGVNLEQAVYYHHEVMDMMLLCQTVGAANKVEFSTMFMQQLERMAEFLRSLMDVSGNIPMLGDADDALIVALSYQPGWCHYRSLLASCALLFNRPDYKYAAASLDDKNRWIFGEEGVRRWNALSAERRDPVMQFPFGGYYLLGRNWGTENEIKAVVDCAPLGYLSIAAHGHADALSIVLSAGGEQLLIDPGTYVYHTQKKWRDYFRSTAAHNTVCIDGVDQSVIGGNFMWMKKANSTLIHFAACADRQVFEGEHDGYLRLPDPVIHRRKIVFDAARSMFIVTDSVICNGEHRVEIYWHFSETSTVSVHSSSGIATAASRKVQVTISAPGLEPSLRRGNEEELSGWISRRFDEKQPTTTLCFSATVYGTTHFNTEIAVHLHSN